MGRSQLKEVMAPKRPSFFINCAVCGTPKRIKPSHAKKILRAFCSRKCMGISQRGPRPDAKVECPCSICGKIKRLKRSAVADGEGKYCSRRCMAQGYAVRLIGTENPNWRHGLGRASLRCKQTREQWRLKNKARVSAYQRNVKAIRRGAIGRFGQQDVANIRQRQRGKCAYCRTDLRKTGEHLDHIIPLARGGTNWRHNLQLLCPKCNRRKSHKPPEVFAREMGFLL